LLAKYKRSTLSGTVSTALALERWMPWTHWLACSLEPQLQLASIGQPEVQQHKIKELIFINE